MAIQQVRAQIDGVWHVLTYNSTTGKYEKTITAPNKTSYNVNAGHYYPITVEATNTAGTIKTVNDTDATVGNSLKLQVKEKVKPTIAITSPGAGAYVTNSKQPIVFQLRDEVNGSGINLSSLALKIDGGSTINSGSPGMVCTPVTNGYDCIYTPQTALSDGTHTVIINVNDYDGNTAAQVSRTYTVDTVPPVLNLTGPTDGLITNQGNIVIAGVTNDSTSSPVTIEYWVNSVSQGTISTEAGNFGTYHAVVTPGTYTIKVRATDAAGKYTEVTRTVTYDNSIPQVTGITITPNPVDAGATMIISVTVTG